MCVYIHTFTAHCGAQGRRGVAAVELAEPLHEAAFLSYDIILIILHRFISYHIRSYYISLPVYHIILY